MTLQGQLAQSQRPLYSHFPPEVQVDVGLLGNRSIQAPKTLAAAGKPVQDFRTHVRTTVTAAPVASAESAEMGWLVENAIALGRHKGEWLLIQGRELLVHSPDFTAVRAAIRERQIRSPFVYYVPTDEESNSVTI